MHDDYSTARASVELSLRATTAGPVRPGLIELESHAYGRGFLVGGFETSSTIGNLFGQAEGMECIGDCRGTFPFILGQPFDIRLFASAGGIGGEGDTAGRGETDFTVRFALRELDGTPVDLLLESESPVAVPEPSTALLLAGALASLILARILGRCRRKREMASM